MIKLSNWSVRANPYAPPESRATRLCGIVSGHPEIDDGDAVTTSRITAARGRVITTRSGTEYRLGRIDPKYRQHLRETGYEYDPREPVKIVEAP